MDQMEFLRNQISNDKKKLSRIHIFGDTKKTKIWNPRIKLKCISIQFLGGEVG